MVTINTKDLAGRKTTIKFENWSKDKGFYVSRTYPNVRISGKNHSWKVEVKFKGRWRPVAFTKNFTRVDPNGVYPKSLTSSIHAIESVLWK